MQTLSAKELSALDINAVVSFTIPNPVFGGSPSAGSSITVTGVLVGFTRSKIGNDFVLHVGNGTYALNEVFQEIVEISFPMRDM